MFLCIKYDKIFLKTGICNFENVIDNVIPIDGLEKRK